MMTLAVLYPAQRNTDPSVLPAAPREALSQPRESISYKLHHPRSLLWESTIFLSRLAATPAWRRMWRQTLGCWPKVGQNLVKWFLDWLLGAAPVNQISSISRNRPCDGQRGLNTLCHLAVRGSFSQAVAAHMHHPLKRWAENTHHYNLQADWITAVGKNW